MSPKTYEKYRTAMGMCYNTGVNNSAGGESGQGLESVLVNIPVASISCGSGMKKEVKNVIADVTRDSYF